MTVLLEPPAIMNELQMLHYAVLFLAVIPWVLYVVMVVCFGVAVVYIQHRMYKKTKLFLPEKEIPGVSIVKPLMGVDSCSETNIESHFRLTYPKFELLFCVQDEFDPAADLVRKLMERYPKVDSHLFIGGKNGVMNPMVHNMAPAYDQAKYDLVWVTTSRIKVNTDILEDMVAKIQHPRVALVHQMPYTTNRSSLGSAIEKIDFGACMSRYYLVSDVFGISCFTGMSYLLKKVELDELNGLSWFGQFLAEDYFIAKLLHDKGFRHKVSAYPAQQNVEKVSISGHKDRMVRWLRLRMNMLPLLSFLFEPMGECLVLGVYGAWSASYLFDFNPYLWFACHCLCWLLSTYILVRLMQKGPMPFSLLLFVVAWIIRTLLYVFVYFEAFSDVRHVTWGRKTYRLFSFGKNIQLVSDKSTLRV